MYPDRPKKCSQPTSTTHLEDSHWEYHPKGWKHLAVVIKESNNMIAALDINAVKKIIFWGKIFPFFLNMANHDLTQLSS